MVEVMMVVVEVGVECDRAFIKPGADKGVVLGDSQDKQR